VPQGLDQDELIEHWTLLGDELERSRAKRGAAGLGFALLWKFFLAHARFPRGRSELPDEAVRFIARQLQLPASELGFYDWTGRTVERHRAEIRQLLGFRECTLADQDAAVDWLVEQVTTADQRHDQVRVELLGWLRSERVEPPTPGRVDRVVRSAVDRGERRLIDRICLRLPAETRERLNGLFYGVPDDPEQGNGDGPDDERDLLGWVKTDPGRLSLNTMSARRDSERASRSSAVTAFAEGGSGRSTSSSIPGDCAAHHKPLKDRPAASRCGVMGSLMRILDEPARRFPTRGLRRFVRQADRRPVRARRSMAA
jgi:Domain of unknown function (DUF4158)